MKLIKVDQPSHFMFKYIFSDVFMSKCCKQFLQFPG